MHVITLPSRIWWRPTTLQSSKPNFLLKSSCSTENYIDNWPSAWVFTLFNVAISWQQNTAPYTYVHGVHKSCPLLQQETVPAVCMVNLQFRLCTSLIVRPTSMVFDLGTRLHVHMHIAAKKFLNRYSSIANKFSYWRISELSQYRSSIRTVSDQYAHIVSEQHEYQVLGLLLQNWYRSSLHAVGIRPLAKKFFCVPVYRSGSAWFQFLFIT